MQNETSCNCQASLEQQEQLNTDLTNTVNTYNDTITGLKASVNQLEQRDTDLMNNHNLYNQTIMEQRNIILQQVNTYYTGLHIKRVYTS